MAENDLKVIVKAKDLAVHTFKLTSNCNRYPKKFRHSLVDRMQNKSMDLYESLLEANRIHNVTHKRERCEMITRAVTLCDELLFYIELSMMLDAQRKFLRMAKLVAAGKLPAEKFQASYGAWKNHISHGNCYHLGRAMDEKMSEILGGNEDGN